MPKRNLLWAAGRLDQASPLKDLLPFIVGGKVELGPLKQMKTFALGFEPIEGITLTGHFQMDNAKAAAKFTAMLEDVKIDGAQSQKVTATPADALEQWVTWQMRGDVAALRGLLDRGKDAKK